MWKSESKLQIDIWSIVPVEDVWLLDELLRSCSIYIVEFIQKYVNSLITASHFGRLTIEDVFGDVTSWLRSNFFYFLHIIPPSIWFSEWCSLKVELYKCLRFENLMIVMLKKTLIGREIKV